MHAAPGILQDFWPVIDNVQIAQGMLFVGDHIIVPKLLRAEMLDLLHETHMGASKTKAWAMNTLFWPGIDANIEKKVAGCALCFHYRNALPKEPLKAHPVPELAWQESRC